MSDAKPRKMGAAEKAVARAVEEQTKELRTELEAKDKRIARLESVLRTISQNALAAVGEVPAVAIAPPALPPVEEPPIPQGPSVDLAQGDNMGEGRWV